MRNNIVSRLASLACCLVLVAPGVASEATSRTEEQSRCITPEMNTGTVYGKLTSEVIFEEVPKVGPGPHTMELRWRMRTVWKIETRTGTYRLTFLDKGMLERAERLEGRQVVATGIIREGELRVLELHAATVPPNIVRTRGKLQFVVRAGDTGKVLFVTDTLPQTFAPTNWSVGFGLTIGDKTVDVVFNNAELRRQAETLVGRRVEVVAIDMGTVLAANELNAVDGSVKTTTLVDMVGDLYLVGVGESLPPQYFYNLKVADKTYHLHLPSRQAGADLEPLSGKRFHVTGVLDGDTVNVSTIKEEGNHSIKKTVKVEIVGVLSVSGIHNARRSYEVWEITAEGKTYQLEFTTRELAQKARDFGSMVVVVFGTLENGVVKVTEICPSCLGDIAVPLAD
jgi:hypothetical protein